MKTNTLAALVALLALTTSSPCLAQKATTGSSSSSSSSSSVSSNSSSAGASRGKPSSVSKRLDILSWSAYDGAELVQQTSLTESQLKALASKIPVEERKYLRELKYVAVVNYRLRETTPLKQAIAFYEPRILAAGYRIYSKDLSDPEEATAMYAGPKEAFLVLTAESNGGEGRTLEIMSVEGPLGSLASMGLMKAKAGKGKR